MRAISKGGGGGVNRARPRDAEGVFSGSTQVSSRFYTKDFLKKGAFRRRWRVVRLLVTSDTPTRQFRAGYMSRHYTRRGALRAKAYLEAKAGNVDFARRHHFRYEVERCD